MIEMHWVWLLLGPFGTFMMGFGLGGLYEFRLSRKEVDYWRGRTQMWIKSYIWQNVPVQEARREAEGIRNAFRPDMVLPWEDVEGNQE